jgi:hypothetical protein
MIIKVDSQKTAKLIGQFCDIALKSLGLPSLKVVQEVLDSVQIDPDLKEPQREEKKEK